MYNQHGFYVEPFVKYRLSVDRIVPIGYTEDNIYTQTYKNTDTFRQLDAGINMNYNNQKWGGVGGNIGYDTHSILISMERALFMSILIRMDIIKDCHGIFMGIIGLSAMV